MKLRKYQQEAVNKMIWDLNNPGNSLTVLPQGSGKTHVIAGFVKEINKPVLILVPNKEILEQDLGKLKLVVPRNEIGVFSASMDSKEIKKYTLATIQSAYKHPEKFAHFDIAIIDECDLLNPKKMNTMYMKFFKEIGIQKVFGLTGTPYRMDVKYEKWGKLKWQVKTIHITKMINRFYKGFWKRMLMVVNTRDLLEKKYLTPIEYVDVSIIKHNQIPTNKSKSNFDLEKFDKMMCIQYTKISDYINNLEHKTKLVFCSSIEQAEALSKLITGSIVVTSKTTKKQREKTVSEIKLGNVEVILNVGIFTVGFDYPELDCLVLLRPTKSLRLHSQILGRVSRIAENKLRGYVYDFVGNIKSMGTLESIEVKQLPAFFRGKEYQAWNVVSSSYPKGLHGEELYSYRLEKPKS